MLRFMDSNYQPRRKRKAGEAPVASASRSRPAHSVLAVHGGAGVIERTLMTPALEGAYRSGLTAALTEGHRILAAGGSSVEAVVAAVTVLEDTPLFNAGRGAAFTAEGT